MGGKGPPYSLRPKSFIPPRTSLVVLVLTRKFSGNSVIMTGILNKTQCTHVPAGASGSSQMRAKLGVLDGNPDHSTGGETLIPSQVYFDGINSFCLKTLLRICISFRI